MKHTLQLPYALRSQINGNTSEVQEIKRVLEKPANLGCQTGIQIFGGPNDWKSYDAVLSGFNELLEKTHQDFGTEIWQYSTLHLPFACRKASAEYHLACPESIRHHEQLLDIAVNRGLTHITLHANTIYYMPAEQKDTSNDYLEDYQTRDNVQRFLWSPARKQEYHFLIENVRLLATMFPEVTFTFENMPLPIMGDTSADGRKLRIEPNLVTTRSIDDFLNKTPANVDLCFDLAHYLISRETLRHYAENPEDLTKNIQILAGSLDAKLDRMIPSPKETLDIINSFEWPTLTGFFQRYETRIGDLQFQGSRVPVWKPNINGISGRIVEEGNSISDDDFEHIYLLEYLSDHGASLRVSIDVSEEDYACRKNQEKMLDLLSSYLCMAGNTRGVDGKDCCRG